MEGYGTAVMMRGEGARESETMFMERNEKQNENRNNKWGMSDTIVF